MANARLIQGPMEKDLLFPHENHRSYHLFNGWIEDKELLARRSDRKMFKLARSIPERVMYYIRLAGFGGVFDYGYKPIDHGLITALVERWRLETHTVHLPIGEVTVTLQDVNVLWGLPIEGEVVSGQGSRIKDDSIAEMLGILVVKEVAKGLTIKL